MVVELFVDIQMEPAPAESVSSTDPTVTRHFVMKLQSQQFTEIDSCAQRQIKRDSFFDRYRDTSDKYGFNVDTCERFEPFFRFFYDRWFEVALLGLENIPPEGRAVLCGNHSGVLPMDAFMMYDGLINYHSSPRRIRFLSNEFIRTAAYVGHVLRGFGSVPAKYDIAIELLKKEELVCFYPEAEKGTGKLFKDRYQLIDFNPGFVKAAIETQSQVIPITTVGGDEIYPLLGNLKPVAKLMGAPYWPVTPLYPWLPFPINAMPLPIKLLICIGKPINLGYPVEKAEDHMFIDGIAKEIQANIQKQLTELLKIRTSPFHKWDLITVNEYYTQFE